MTYIKSLLIIFFCFYSFSLYGDEIDNVSPDSNDYETSKLDDEIYDPIEPINRAIFGFNNTADRLILEPIAKGYRKLPSPIQTGVNNFLSNLRTPLVVVNQLLQGQGKNAAESTGRFLINTTAGVLGLVDVADKVGLEEKKEDLKALWKFYLILKILKNT